MNSPLPASGPAQRNWTRRLANVLVALVVIAVAAATFVFSYDGVHAIALLGGVSGQLARYYPGLFDAVLVIACVAAVMLRDGRWWARLWAWVVIIVLLAAIGTTDVLHAMNYTLRHRVTEGVVAAAPVAAVLLAFSLLLTLLRQTKTQAPAPAAPETIEVPALTAAFAPPIALPAAPVDAETAPTEAVPVFAGGPVPDVAPTRADPVIADAPEPAAAASAAAASSVDEVDEPAPPTVVVPALAPEPPPAAAQARESHGIRYAGGGVPGMAGKQQPTAEDAGDAGDDAPPDADYWESEEAGQYAGLVYAAREDQASAEDDAEAGDADEADQADADEPVAHKSLPELDDDAPPFATAPFASVPRLNRVRSTPAPPADEEE